MERDSSVKRLNFEDVSLTVPKIHELGASALSQSGNAVEEVSGEDSASMVDLPDNCSIAELRKEARTIREKLAKSENLVNYFSEVIPKVKAEADDNHTSEKQWKGTREFLYERVPVLVGSRTEYAKPCTASDENPRVNVFSMLGEEFLELSVKERILERLAKWKIGDEKIQDGNWGTIESGTEQRELDELTALRNANAETILEIEALIQTIATDVNELDTDLSTASGCLDAFDKEVDKLAEESDTVAFPDNNANGHSIVVSKQSQNLQDLDSTIRHLEETLSQNETEYVQAEAAMESRIKQYNCEIEELQAQAKELDREEECMKLLIDVAARYLQVQKHMECSNDVSIISIEDGCIDLRLTTYVPTIDDHKDAKEQDGNPVWEHNLHIKINQATMEIEEAKLSPEDVPIDNLFSEAQERCVNNAVLETGQDGELAKFGPHLAFLVRAVHQRLTVHAFKLASLSSASRDPRYCLEHVPGSSVITVTKPGKLRALVEVPLDWPMHGYFLRLQSLDSLATESNTAVSLDAMNTALDVANKMPEYVRHDLLTFIQAVEQIVSE